MSIEKMMLERLNSYQQEINSLEVLIEHFEDQNYIEVETVEVDHQMINSTDEYISIRKKKPLTMTSCKIKVDFLRRALEAYKEDMEECNEYFNNLNK